jgi:hypothetical protein
MIHFKDSAAVIQFRINGQANAKAPTNLPKSFPSGCKVANLAP